MTIAFSWLYKNDYVSSSVVNIVVFFSFFVCVLLFLSLYSYPTILIAVGIDFIICYNCNCYHSLSFIVIAIVCWWCYPIVIIDITTAATATTTICIIATIVSNITNKITDITLVHIFPYYKPIQSKFVYRKYD